MAIPMRTIESFTSFKSIEKFAPAGISESELLKFSRKIFSYLIDQDYYKNVRKMLDEKIAENTYDEITATPRTEISRVILDMIERPLKLINSTSTLSDEEFNSKILTAFTNEILAKDSNFTIINFIIPSLATRLDFPFLKLINFLNNYINVKLTQDTNSNSIEKVKFNGFLLYAILNLDRIFLGEIISKEYLQQYLIVIGSMISCISKLPKSNEYTRFSNYEEDENEAHEADSSEDEEETDIDDEMQPQIERLILINIIQQLNDEYRVNTIVKNIDSILHIPNVIHSVCVVAHSLMIFNRAAINEYR